jgi:PTH1 family peptidyl-tRNA hydrolase
MKLIVGLGNPGRQYQRTPHNVGFDVVDLLAARHGGVWRLERRFEAETAEVAIAGALRTLMKPLTYMNLSGHSVGAFIAKNGGEPAEILAINDDTNLPLGQIRLRPNGSHGGHKGLLSIINTLGSLEYPRLRIGVRPDAEINDRVEYVLGKFSPPQWEEIRIAEQEAADAVEMVLERGFEAAMGKFNRRKAQGTD